VLPLDPARAAAENPPACEDVEDCHAYTLDVCAASRTVASCVERGTGNSLAKVCQCLCPLGMKGPLCDLFDVPDELDNCNSRPGEPPRAGPALLHDGKFVCNCLHGYSGDKCEIFGCEQSSCYGHGVCHRNSIACSCDQGWAGLECSRRVCAKHPIVVDGAPGAAVSGLECSGSARGQCINGTCACAPGWGGEACDQHGCGPREDCSGHGGCDQSTHTCSCASGWQGQLCDAKKCPARQTGDGIKQCSDHGACSDGACQCDCTDKDNCWLGDACGVQACPGKTAEGVHCSAHGTCDRDVATSKFSCSCELGFYGPGCSVSCPRDCSGHGTCGGDGTCACDAPWTGPGCAQTCAGKCKHGGHCNLDTGKCDKCPGKWHGEFCEKPTCDAPACHKEGAESCFASETSDGSGQCMCREGWVGEDCGMKLCPGCFGKCNDGKCECGTHVKGFERHHGAHCEIVECADPTCGGHGECHQNANASDAKGGSLAGTCDCDAGFSGAGCENLACELGGPAGEQQECTSDEHGSCVEGKCECRDGWGGSACDRKVCPKVQGVECNNHGICLGDGTCECATERDEMENLLGGWAGGGCQLSYCGVGDGLSGKGCSGHGVCSSEATSTTGALPQCKCDDGWDGNHCQRKICPMFNDMECGGQLRGSCRQVAVKDNSSAALGAPNQFDVFGVCDCAEGFRGVDCGGMVCREFEESAVCAGHGRCDNSTSPITCVDCADGWAGAFCHLPTTVESDPEEVEQEIKANKTYVNLIKDAEKKAEQVVEKDDGEMRAARARLAQQQAEQAALQDEANRLNSKKKNIQNQIGNMINTLSGLNETARNNDARVATPQTPNPCITRGLDGASRPQVCGGHGACSDAKDNKDKACHCEKGWGSQWTLPGEAQGDDMYCEHKSCPGECSRKGRCMRGVCFCEPGFSGTACDRAVCVDKCEGEHQFAVYEHGKCACACVSGWEGPKCENKTVVPTCLDDCGEHGACENGVCACMDSWEGEFCEIAPCPTETPGTPCTGHGMCLDESASCACDKGFTGPACSLLDCSGPELRNCSSPTHGQCNNGTCVCREGWQGKDCGQVVEQQCPLGCSDIGDCHDGKCYCPPGYYGKACQKTYNLCTPSPDCSGHGQCNVTVCNCANGWRGDACDLEIKTCPSGCSNHGACDTSTGVCACEDAWNGSPACSARTCPKGCGGHGSCNNGTCACEASWEGPRCGERTCPDGCSGHGTCMSPRAGAPKGSAQSVPFCKCDKDFSGVACEISAGGCMVDMGEGNSPLQCAGHGFCERDNFCSCFVGWDPNSDCKAALCDPADCSGHGTCQDDATCACQPGWLGSGCDTKACPRGVGKNKGLLCSGHGVCNDGTKECDCAEGWCGQNCGEVKKIDFPEGCASMDAENTLMCSGHGSCRQLPTPPGAPPRGQCECDERWGGGDCSTARCQFDCSGHGTCDELLTCQCDAGFGGEGCEKKTCDVLGCVNGNCTVDGTCACNTRWSGLSCEEELCPGNCHGHGMCLDDTTCQCRNGYSGKGCEDAPGCIDECGRGQCEPLKGGGGKCKCPLGLQGLACEVELCAGALTDAGACFGHGECTVGLGANGDEGQCACDQLHGYTEKSGCEKSRCPKGCSQNGVCNDDNTCTCDVGYLGEDCSKVGCPLGYRNKEGATTPCTLQFCSPNTPGDVSCGGKGTCDSDQGKCVCEKGFWGDGCQESLCTPTCVNGKCRKLDHASRGVCICDQGFSGAGCNIAYCGETDAKTGKACSAGSGVCLHSEQRCECGAGYRGHFCEVAYCGEAGACSGHGTCDQPSESCQCSTGWGGKDCGKPSCGVNGDCSGHGVCLKDDGNGNAFKCDCMDGWGTKKPEDCSQRDDGAEALKLPAAASQAEKKQEKDKKKAVAKLAKAKARAACLEKAGVPMGTTCEGFCSNAFEKKNNPLEKICGWKKCGACEQCRTEEIAACEKVVEQETLAAAGEERAVEPEGTIHLAVPLVVRGSPGDTDSVLTDIFQGMFQGAAANGGRNALNEPMYDIAARLNKVAHRVCEDSKRGAEAACVPRLSIPIQYAVSDMAREFCAHTPDGQCDIQTVKAERISAIARDVEAAVPFMTADVNTFDQVKSNILAAKLFAALKVAPARRDDVEQAMAAITAHYAHRFSNSLTVVNNAATLIQELAQIDADSADDATNKKSKIEMLSRAHLLSKCAVVSHALLQSEGQISPARALLAQALVMHTIQGLSTFAYDEDVLVAVSQATLASAAIPDTNPLDKSTMSSFNCLARGVLGLSKKASTIAKHNVNADDVHVATKCLHTLAVQESGDVDDAKLNGEALVHLCATGQLDRHDGKITVAEACVTPVVAAKVLAEKHPEIKQATPEEIKKIEAAFVGSTSNVIKHVIATENGKQCPGNW
jgi:hypothetical protein